MAEITEATGIEELAVMISEALEAAGITATLSGGGAVSIYSKNQYMSPDLDFLTSADHKSLLNAIAHRDDSVQGAGIEVWLFDNRMEVTSPGGLPQELSLDELLSLRRVHCSRNPRLFVEMADAFLPTPRIDPTPRSVSVVLRNTTTLREDDRGFVGRRLGSRRATGGSRGARLRSRGAGGRSRGAAAPFVAGGHGRAWGTSQKGAPASGHCPALRGPLANSGLAGRAAQYGSR